MNKRLFSASLLFCTLSFAAINNTLAAPILWVSDLSGGLGTVDVQTGNVNFIGNTGVAMFDIAFAPNGDLYGTANGSSLYKINPDTAASTFIGSTGTFINSLVFDSAGTLYGANNALYTLDINTGASSLVGNGGDAYSSSGDLAFIGGQLHLSSFGSSDSLVRIDTGTGFGTSIGDIGFSGVFGLATDNNVDLYGVVGTQVLSIDVATGAGSFLIDYSGQGLSTAAGSSFIGEASVVPVPAAVWLFGSGLLGLIGIAKRKKA